jgi:hypothetical protein
LHIPQPPTTGPDLPDLLTGTGTFLPKKEDHLKPVRQQSKEPLVEVRLSRSVNSYIRYSGVSTRRLSNGNLDSTHARASAVVLANHRPIPSPSHRSRLSKIGCHWFRASFRSMKSPICIMACVPFLFGADRSVMPGPLSQKADYLA